MAAQKPSQRSRNNCRSPARKDLRCQSCTRVPSWHRAQPRKERAEQEDSKLFLDPPPPTPLRREVPGQTAVPSWRDRRAHEAHHCGNRRTRIAGDPASGEMEHSQGFTTRSLPGFHSADQEAPAPSFLPSAAEAGPVPSSLAAQSGGASAELALRLGGLSLFPCSYKTLLISWGQQERVSQSPTAPLSPQQPEAHFTETETGPEAKELVPGHRAGEQCCRLPFQALSCRFALM